MDLEVTVQEVFLSNGSFIKGHNDLGANPAALLPVAAQVTRQAYDQKNVLVLLKGICFSFLGCNESVALHFGGTL